jgi:GDP-L-fucose synthase
LRICAFLDSESKVFVAGNRGLVGSAIVRNLIAKGYKNIYSAPRTHFDLRDQNDVEKYFEVNRPEYVFLAAAKVGGIKANSDYPAQFIRDNLQIQTNVIDAAYRHGVKKLVFLGSSCIYPKFATQPITEDQFMTGPLEPTNDSYAIAKIAGIRMCQAYYQQYGFKAISLMPTNLYGPNDNFDLETSHVLPAMIAKFHNAMKNNESVTLWGDGSAMREFLHVDDLAEACYVCMQKYDEPEHINVGTGEDVRIWELASIISDVVAFSGEILWDFTKPNGTPRKVLNIDKIKELGWEPKINLQKGIELTYEWYKTNG